MCCTNNYLCVVGEQKEEMNEVSLTKSKHLLILCFAYLLWSIKSYKLCVSQMCVVILKLL